MPTRHGRVVAVDHANEMLLAEQLPKRAVRWGAEHAKCERHLAVRERDAGRVVEVRHGVEELRPATLPGQPLQGHSGIKRMADGSFMSGLSTQAVQPAAWRV